MATTMHVVGFTGLAPDEVTTLAARLRAAADALESSAGTAAAAGTLSGLGDAGIAARAHALRSALRSAAATLDRRAEELGGFRLPAVDRARRIAVSDQVDVGQEPTPTPPPANAPPPRSHFMDDSIWLTASVVPEPAGAIPMAPGTTWGVNYEGNIFGDVSKIGAQGSWVVDVQVLPSGEVNVRFGNDVAVELINGTPSGSALGGVVEGGLEWRTPPSWLAPNLLALLPNTAQYSRTYRFPSVKKFEAFWTVFTDAVGAGLGQADPSDPVAIGTAHATFAHLYDQLMPGYAPVARSIGVGQRLEILGHIDLTPLEALARGGTGSAATDAFLSRLIGALHGELNGQVEYGIDVDGHLLPGYTSPGATYPLVDGWSDTIWLRVQGEAEVLTTARTMLWGEQVGDQIKGEVRAGLVLDRWGEPRQVVLKATVAGYQFDNGMICIPLAGQGWLTIDVDGRSQFTQTLEENIVMTDATLRIIEFERTIDLWPDRTALARQYLALELRQSGVERLNLAVTKDPTADDRLVEARSELDLLLEAAGQPPITDEQWLALLDFTLQDPQWYSGLGGTGDADLPAEQVFHWAQGTPLQAVADQYGGLLNQWGLEYLQPLGLLTQTSVLGSPGLTPGEIDAEIDRRMAALDTPEKVNAFLAANGVDPAGWEITTYQGVVGTNQVEGAAEIADNAALAVAGGIESSMTKYWEIGHWTFTDAGYAEFMANTAPIAGDAFSFLLLHNQTRLGPMPPYDAPATPQPTSP